jgi:DNA-binding response OmpR family regulator
LALLATSGRYEGIACATGSAVRMLGETPRPAALLVDVRLDGSNGFQLLKDLRTRGFTTPVVMLSSSDDAHYQSHAEAMGACAFVCKTTDCGGIILTLDRLLNFVIETT